MNYTEIANKIHDEYRGRHMPRRIFCFILGLDAPEHSQEKQLFRDAEGFYEQCEVNGNRTCLSHKLRMKARRRFKKAWSLRETRLNGGGQ